MAACVVHSLAVALGSSDMPALHCKCWESHPHGYHVKQDPPCQAVCRHMHPWHHWQQSCLNMMKHLSVQARLRALAPDCSIVAVAVMGWEAFQVARRHSLFESTGEGQGFGPWPNHSTVPALPGYLLARRKAHGAASIVNCFGIQAKSGA